jgi:hypothetical protein
LGTLSKRQLTRDLPVNWVEFTRSGGLVTDQSAMVCVGASCCNQRGLG